MRIIYPTACSPRVIVQSGVFTIQEDPWAELQTCAGKDYADEDLDVQEIVKLSVPAAAKRSILEQLEKMDINRRTLFPDLDGLAGGLLETEIMRRGLPDP